MMATRWQVSFLSEFPQGGLSHVGGLQLLTTMTSLFTDVAGNAAILICWTQDFLSIFYHRNLFKSKSVSSPETNVWNTEIRLAAFPTIFLKRVWRGGKEEREEDQRNERRRRWKKEKG